MDHLIFGGAGFIGDHLKQYLKNLGEKQILTLDIKESNGDFVLSDARKPIAVKVNTSENAIIYNLAAVHTTPGHLDQEYFDTNIRSAENICNFARKNNIQTIVFTSSIAPYGASEELKTEETLPMPNTPYGISKLTAEYIHKVWQAEEPQKRKLIIVRPGVVFGKLEKGNFTRLYESIKKGTFFYPGRKDTVKACVYVKDVARILYEAAKHEPPGHLILNLTYFPAPAIEAICITMAEVTGLKPPGITVPGWILKFSANSVYRTAGIFGKKMSGIHPDRVKKLMISTNISGKKLSHSPYKLQFTLKEALSDWFKDCGEKKLF